MKKVLVALTILVVLVFSHQDFPTQSIKAEQGGLSFTPVMNQAVYWSPSPGVIRSGTIYEVIDAVAGLVGIDCHDYVRDHRWPGTTMQTTPSQVNNLTWPSQVATDTRAMVLKLGTLPDPVGVQYRSAQDHGTLLTWVPPALVGGSQTCPAGTLNSAAGNPTLNTSPTMPINGLCAVTATYYIPFSGTPGNPAAFSWAEDPNFRGPVRKSAQR
jgi:hypothetical protein